jgi:hypothetical protein
MAIADFSATMPQLCFFLIGLVAPVLLSGKVRGVERDAILSVNKSLFQMMTLSNSQKRFAKNPEILRAKFLSRVSADILSPGFSEFSAIRHTSGGAATMATKS